MLTYEQLTEIAREAKKDFRIKSPAKKKIRVGAPFSDCLREMKRNRFTAHCHVHNRNRRDRYGRICVRMSYYPTDKELIEVAYHEVLHFRYYNHTDRFRRELYDTLRIREERLKGLNTTILPSVGEEI